MHKQIFTHIVALPTAWRQLDHMVLAMTCYVPFAAIQASKSLPQGSVKGTANCPSVNTEYSGNITSGVSSDPVFVFYVRCLFDFLHPYCHNIAFYIILTDILS